jgi:hypothetical protein
MPERRLISAWLALYLADPARTPDLLEWLKSPEGKLARKLAPPADCRINPEPLAETRKPRLRVIQGGRAGPNARLDAASIRIHC